MLSSHGMKWLMSGNVGIMSVFIDDLRSPVLVCPVALDRILSLQEGMARIGFTASTGNAHQVHDIQSWMFTSDMCKNDCSDRGSCYQGVCHCEAGFVGVDCSGEDGGASLFQPAGTSQFDVASTYDKTYTQRFQAHSE